jgi:hypothetical protein
MRKTILIGLAVAAAIAGCSDAAGPGGGLTPTIVALPAGAPPLYQASTSFYAKKGEDREGSLYFQDASGGPGERFARLRVRAASLLALPDGTPIGIGDSVLITLQVVDPTQLLVELDPGGLKFDPLAPATLELSYSVTGGDLDDDGQVSLADTVIAGKLGIWRQETAGAPFVLLPSTRLLDLEEVTAQLSGFSRYALAY